MQKAGETGRILWLDVARALAIVLVIICHATERVYPLDLESMSQVGAASQIFAFVLFTLGRLGVPLFLFISGYLLLDREYDADGCRMFYRTKFVPLLICTEVWILLYDAFIVLVRGIALEPMTVVCDMLFLGLGPASHFAVDMPHFWYMPMILGLYLFIPLVARALRKLPLSLVGGLLGLVALYEFALPVANVVLAALGMDTVSTQLGLGFDGGIYGMYLVAGWIVKRRGLSRVPAVIMLLAAVAFIAGAVALQLWSYGQGSAYNVWYNNGLLALGGFALFVCLSHLKSVPGEGVVGSIARYSFGIYLIHMPVVILVCPLIVALPIPTPLKVIAVALIAFGAAYALAWGIGKLGKPGRFLLYLK